LLLASLSSLVEYLWVRLLLQTGTPIRLIKKAQFSEKVAKIVAKLKFAQNIYIKAQLKSSKKLYQTTFENMF
jgi:hypothetical protein